MNINAVFVREKLVKAVREFFYERKFHEVITPVLNRALPLEPNIYAFETEWQKVRSNETLYLSTSPESGLKKMLSQGIGNCFSIGKCFRNLEDSSDRHNPEFLMLEWYRQGATYLDIMDDVQELITSLVPRKSTYQGKNITVSDTWKLYSLVDLYTHYVGFSYLDVLDESSLQKRASEKGYNAEGATWEQLFNQIFLNEIEPHLGFDPCFITDFPSQISPLCVPKNDNPAIVERFEIYLAGMELGNGNTEYTKSQNVKTLFELEAENRRKRNSTSPPIDQEFLTALDSLNAYTYAGIGLGLDRLAMILADTTSIADVDPLAVR